MSQTGAATEARWTANAEAVAAGVNVDLQTLISMRAHAWKVPLGALRLRAPDSGLRSSPFKGRGMEFEESRPYQPGDDLRSLDWRVMARTGKPYTKLFREERERPVLLWVDLRVGMMFGTRNAYKAAVAARAAAVLAWAALENGDRIGGLAFSDDAHEEWRPQRGKRAVLHLLERLSSHPGWATTSGTWPQGSCSASEALEPLLRVARPGSLVFLISDFRNPGTQLDTQLARLARRNDVVAVQLSDPLEQQLPPEGLYRVADAMQTLSLDTRGGKRRRAYREAFEAHSEHLLQLCRQHGMHHLACSTGDELIDTLRKGLGLRTLASRGRR